MKNNIESSKHEERKLEISYLCKKSIELIRYSRNLVVHNINQIQILTYFSIGKWIVEEQLKGLDRAQYGERVIEKLSNALNAEFGKGFARESLNNFRKFYLTYQDRISQPVVTKFIEERNVSQLSHIIEGFPFSLSWTHYLILMRIKDKEERDFYEIEATKQMWSKRTLQRQYSSCLYERLALSRDKKAVINLAREGNEVSKPEDLIKNHTVLEFVGLEEKSKYTESQLESAIIDKMQNFLLELGKGFLFEARQKRFTFDEDSYYVDLVLYNRLLRCYVLIDLKVSKLTHQDLGQMLMYVNYYDRFVKNDDENPTVGILLCSEKNDNMVQLTLPEETNIYASKYELYLPDKKLLQKKLEEWLNEDDNSENY